jgi:hypothetical protein
VALFGPELAADVAHAKTVAILKFIVIFVLDREEKSAKAH